MRYFIDGSIMRLLRARLVSEFTAYRRSSFISAVLSLLACTTFISSILFSSLTPLFANEGPHGYYSMITAKCAICHRAHTAVFDFLLKGDDVVDATANGVNTDIADFCLSCHKNGAGANNNVYGGYFMGYAGPGNAGSTADISTNPWLGEMTNTSNLGTKNAGLNGGGFVTAKPYFGPPNKLTYNGRTMRGVNWTDPVGGTHFNHTSSDPIATTSHHNALDDTKVWTAWGSVNNVDPDFNPCTNCGPGMIVTITCVSCHDQHGSNHYRILRDSDSHTTGILPGDISWLIMGWVDQVNEFGAGIQKYPDRNNYIESWESEFVAGGLTKDYTSYSYKYNSSGDATISDFCKTCHSQYYNRTSPSLSSFAPYDAGDGLGTISRYRHYTEATFDRAPGGCASGINCASENLNKWVQLPFASSADVVLGIRNGVPIYLASIDPAKDFIVCTTCHQAHGTTATVGAGARVGPTKYAEGSNPGHSNLLRLNNRGVCEDCHGWTPAKDENGNPCSNNYGSDDIANCTAPIGP